MDEIEFVQQDRQTREWLRDLDNFGKPPPPRHLKAADSESSSSTSTVPVGDIRHDFYGQNGLDFVQNDQFMDKVRQFQLSGHHPYTNRNVETSKQIALDGGTRSVAHTLKTAEKQRITKEEAAQITESVRRLNRPHNPWAEKPKSPIQNGDNSSSAYSSYSSVGSPAVVYSATRAVLSPHPVQKESSPFGLTRDDDFRKAMDEFADSAARLAHSQSPTPVPENKDYRVIIPHTDTLSNKSTPCRPVYLPHNERDSIGKSLPPMYNRSITPTTRIQQAPINTHAPPAPPLNEQLHVDAVAVPLASTKLSDHSSSLDSAYEQFENTLRHDLQKPPPSPRQRLSRDVIVDRIPPTGTTRVPPGTRRRHASSPLSPKIPTSNSLQSMSRSPDHSLSMTPPPWRVANHQPGVYKPRSSNSLEALQNQQRKYEQLQSEVAEQMEKTNTVYGSCYKCKQAVTDPNDATQALGHLYHSGCFVCFSCGRELRGKRFYEVAEKTYCEEDYLYSGFQQSAERCSACRHLIMDMVLQAVGKSFHPQCFRCFSCKECLDGIPFALDHSGKVYCVRDYHKLFAPNCAACGNPIMPVSDTDETVRVVAMNRDYHIDCYVCEGCGIQLTDEQKKRCYPLGQHLLCQSCHGIWSRTGGTQHPITDL